MTDQEILIYYSDLLILQYKGKPKATGTVQAMVDTVVSGQLPQAIQNAYNLDTAVGAQLDVLGKYAGVTRDGSSFSGPMVLDDEDYRKIIKLKIIKNNSGSSLSDIQDLLALYFEGQIKVFDYKDMSMSYYVSAAFGSQQLVEFFINKGLLPVPMAVGLGSTVYHPDLKFFSFSTYKEGIPAEYPFNEYTDQHDEWPWLTYSYAINSGSVISQNMLTESGQKILQENGDEIYV